jgi:hypothetical protein
MANTNIKQHHLMAQGQKVTGMKKGGAVKHEDAAQDKKMIDAEFAKRGLKGGGRAKRGC